MAQYHKIGNVQGATFNKALDSFLSAVSEGNSTSCIDTLSAILWNIFANDLLASHYVLGLGDHEVARTMSSVEENLGTICPDMNRMAISYICNELICNIQQHSGAAQGYLYVNYDSTCHAVDIVVADRGRGIYGSYVNAQKYIDKLSDSDVDAVILAQEGYSTKDRPNAENRGYGISTSLKMVVKGLKGHFAILSGNALLINSALKAKEIFELPDKIEWNGTMIVIRIPIPNPNNFNFYDYIE